jgi:PAB-dependent poly(A)-specific ribonuclease subunit 2
MIFEVGGPPIKIDPVILNNLTRTEFGGYAPNPRKTRRNQAEDARAAEKAIAALEGPKFLSERAKDGQSEDAGRRMSEILDQLTTSTLDGSLKIDVPVMYRNVEIKYSKFGVEDFDFEYVTPHDTVTD